jgi:acyl-CoA synthetase (AMP-forming)/AMP-acid ligase II
MRALVDSESGEQWSWAEAGRDVHRIAGGLAALGVSRGDTVAVALRNRPQFNLVDAAAFIIRRGSVISRPRRRRVPRRR